MGYHTHTHIHISSTATSSDKGHEQASGETCMKEKELLRFLLFPQLTHALGKAKEATASVGKFTKSLVRQP